MVSCVIFLNIYCKDNSFKTIDRMFIPKNTQPFNQGVIKNA